MWRTYLNILNKVCSPKTILIVTLRIFEFMLGNYNLYSMVQLVEHSTTSRKFMSLIPDGAIRIFN